MRLKINFGASDKGYRLPLNKEVNGFINRILGSGNEYHGSFSRYSVSSMQGGHMDKDGTLTFKDGGYIYVSSDDESFIGKVILGLLKNNNIGVIDMPYINYELCDFDVNERFDMVRTVSPISLRKDNKPLTFKDQGFCQHLLETSRKKLIHCGYEEKDVNRLSIKLHHAENAKTKMVGIGNAKIVCSQVMMIVEGPKNIRKALYENGIGMSTGFGFGAVTINKKY